MPPLACRDAVESLLELIEGTLPPALTREVGEHLTICPWCERVMQSYKRTMTLCNKAMSRPAPTGMCDRLLASLREHANKPHNTR